MERWLLGGKYPHIKRALKRVLCCLYRKEITMFCLSNTTAPPTRYMFIMGFPHLHGSTCSVSKIICACVRVSEVV